MSVSLSFYGENLNVITLFDAKFSSFADPPTRYHTLVSLSFDDRNLIFINSLKQIFVCHFCNGSASASFGKYTFYFFFIGRENQPSVTDPVTSIFSPDFRGKNVTGSANFPPGCPLLSGRCFALFKDIQIIYAGYVKVAPGKPQTDRVKLKTSPVPGRLNFHWVKG